VRKFKRTEFLLSAEVAVYRRQDRKNCSGTPSLCNWSVEIKWCKERDTPRRCNGKKEEKMLEIIEGMPENVVAVNARGKVTGEDYDDVLIPVIEDKLKKNKKIRVLYVLGPDFSGFTAGAMWDDAKIGIRHLTAYEKVAVVSDVSWVVNATKFFSFIIPCPVKIFGNDKLSEAKAWICE
jgi:hypothetical protein